MKITLVLVLLLLILCSLLAADTLQVTEKSALIESNVGVFPRTLKVSSAVGAFLGFLIAAVVGIGVTLSKRSTRHMLIKSIRLGVTWKHAVGIVVLALLANAVLVGFAGWKLVSLMSEGRIEELLIDGTHAEYVIVKVKFSFPTSNWLYALRVSTLEGATADLYLPDLGYAEEPLASYILPSISLGHSHTVVEMMDDDRYARMTMKAFKFNSSQLDNLKSIKYVVKVSMFAYTFSTIIPVFYRNISLKGEIKTGGDGDKSNASKNSILRLLNMDFSKHNGSEFLALKSNLEIGCPQSICKRRDSFSLLLPDFSFDISKSDAAHRFLSLSLSSDKAGFSSSVLLHNHKDSDWKSVFEMLFKKDDSSSFNVAVKADVKSHLCDTLRLTFDGTYSISKCKTAWKKWKSLQKPAASKPEAAPEAATKLANVHFKVLKSTKPSFSINFEIDEALILKKLNIEQISVSIPQIQMKMEHNKNELLQVKFTQDKALGFNLQITIDDMPSLLKFALLRSAILNKVSLTDYPADYKVIDHINVSFDQCSLSINNILKPLKVTLASDASIYFTDTPEVKIAESDKVEPPEKRVEGHLLKIPTHHALINVEETLDLLKASINMTLNNSWASEANYLNITWEDLSFVFNIYNEDIAGGSLKAGKVNFSLFGEGSLLTNLFADSSPIIADLQFGSSKGVITTAEILKQVKSNSEIPETCQLKIRQENGEEMICEMFIPSSKMTKKESTAATSSKMYEKLFVSIGAINGNVVAPLIGFLPRPVHSKDNGYIVNMDLQIPSIDFHVKSDESNNMESILACSTPIMTISGQLNSGDFFLQKTDYKQDIFKNSIVKSLKTFEHPIIPIRIENLMKFDEKIKKFFEDKNVPRKIKYSIEGDKFIGRYMSTMFSNEVDEPVDGIMQHESSVEQPLDINVSLDSSEKNLICLQLSIKVPKSPLPFDASQIYSDGVYIKMPRTDFGFVFNDSSSFQVHIDRINLPIRLKPELPLDPRLEFDDQVEIKIIGHTPKADYSSDDLRSGLNWLMTTSKSEDKICTFYAKLNSQDRSVGPIEFDEQTGTQEVKLASLESTFSVIKEKTEKWQILKKAKTEDNIDMKEEPSGYVDVKFSQIPGAMPQGQIPCILKNTCPVSEASQQGLVRVLLDFQMDLALLLKNSVQRILDELPYPPKSLNISLSNKSSLMLSLFINETIEVMSIDIKPFKWVLADEHKIAPIDVYVNHGNEKLISLFNPISLLPLPRIMHPPKYMIPLSYNPMTFALRNHHLNNRSLLGSLLCGSFISMTQIDRFAVTKQSEAIHEKKEKSFSVTTKKVDENSASLSFKFVKPFNFPDFLKVDMKKFSANLNKGSDQVLSITASDFALHGKSMLPEFEIRMFSPIGPFVGDLLSGSTMKPTMEIFLEQDENVQLTLPMDIQKRDSLFDRLVDMYLYNDDEHSNPIEPEEKPSPSLIASHTKDLLDKKIVGLLSHSATFNYSYQDFDIGIRKSLILDDIDVRIDFAGLLTKFNFGNKLDLFLTVSNYGCGSQSKDLPAMTDCNWKTPMPLILDKSANFKPSLLQVSTTYFGRTVNIVTSYTAYAISFLPQNEFLSIKDKLIKYFSSDKEQNEDLTGTVTFGLEPWKLPKIMSQKSSGIHMNAELTGESYLGFKIIQNEAIFPLNIPLKMPFYFGAANEDLKDENIVGDNIYLQDQKKIVHKNDVWSFKFTKGEPSQFHVVLKGRNLSFITISFEMKNVVVKSMNGEAIKNISINDQLLQCELIHLPFDQKLFLSCTNTKNEAFQHALKLPSGSPDTLEISIEPWAGKPDPKFESISLIIAKPNVALTDVYYSSSVPSVGKETNLYLRFKFSEKILIPANDMKIKVKAVGPVELASARTSNGMQILKVLFKFQQPGTYYIHVLLNESEPWIQLRDPVYVRPFW